MEVSSVVDDAGTVAPVRGLVIPAKVFSITCQPTRQAGSKKGVQPPVEGLRRVVLQPRNDGRRVELVVTRLVVSAPQNENSQKYSS